MESGIEQRLRIVSVALQTLSHYGALTLDDGKRISFLYWFVALLGRSFQGMSYDVLKTSSHIKYNFTANEAKELEAIKTRKIPSALYPVRIIGIEDYQWVEKLLDEDYVITY